MSRPMAAIGSAVFSNPSSSAASASQCRAWFSTRCRATLSRAGLNRRDLGEDVDAVALFTEHPFDAADLPRDAHGLSSGSLVARAG